MLLSFGLRPWFGLCPVQKVSATYPRAHLLVELVTQKFSRAKPEPGAQPKGKGALSARQSRRRTSDGTAEADRPRQFGCGFCCAAQSVDDSERQIDGELGAFAGLTGDANPTTMLLDNLFHNRQTQARTTFLR